MTLSDDFIHAVENVTGRQGRRVGKETRLLCPAHDDTTPSLEVTEGDDGRPLVQCRSRGCTYADMCAALGRDQKDFLPDRDRPAERRAVATYPYTDENGQLLYEVVRFDPKDFRQRRPDGNGGWIWNLQDTPRVLYRLPVVVDTAAVGETLYVVEGEKDVHAVEKAGAAATTCPMGAGKWRPEYAQQLLGANVIVVTDQDQAGRDHARTVAASIAAAANGHAQHVTIVAPVVGKDVADHLAAGYALDELQQVTLDNGDATPVEPPPRLALRLHEFLDLDIPRPPPLLGKDGDVVIPAGGLTVLAGMPGVGKTTLALDLVFHLASARDWLGLPANDPLNILLIENEGPQYLFQDKLRRKTDAWKTTLNGEIHVQTWRWASFTFRDPDAVNVASEYLDANQIHLVIGDPLDTLGPQGIGSPEETREFAAMLVPLGLTQTRAFVFLHHFRKEASSSEIDQVSGAWGGRLDTLLVLKPTDNRDELRLSFPKLRHGEDRNPLILGKLRDQQTFEVLAEETHAPGDKVTASLRLILLELGKSATPLNRTALALRLEVEHNDSSFGRALNRGVNDGLIAKGKDGKSVFYALTQEGHDAAQ